MELYHKRFMGLIKSTYILCMSQLVSVDKLTKWSVDHEERFCRSALRGQEEEKSIKQMQFW